VRVRTFALSLAVALLAPPTVGATEDWVEIDYGAIVDGRRLSHSGESVSSLLERLGGRPLPPPGERPADALAYRLLDPLMEPYAFVLPDALDTLGPAPDPPMVELGALYAPGSAQPAWAELLRSRVWVVESDGAGRLRICLPWSEGVDAPPSIGSEEAGEQAWERAWPTLRHVLAAERRRLAGGDVPADRLPTLEVAVHPYADRMARTRFLLGTRPYRVKVEDTRSHGRRPPLDLEAWQRFLDSGLRLEGARLVRDGSLRFLGSETSSPPRLLGRPVELSDLAVAYRAVFHGGLGEPYMSLDRSLWPQDSIVNYGGRLRDTRIGLVSLLCDIRFKTFSLGIDVAEAKDIRERIRAELDDFRTHLERFAADPRSLQVSGQQTRLWFYPDDVDLTLSAQGDILIIGSPRMTAASERLEEQTWQSARRADPPWTLATVGAINDRYDDLDALFPELSDLDQVVRMLSLFTWLRFARDEGQAVPDLDALMALELPAQPTDRTFHQLLAFIALPQSGSGEGVTVIERSEVAQALDRLRPPSGLPLPSRQRFDRALATLDRARPDQAALARDLAALDPATVAAAELDLLAYRADRLRMHQLVLGTLPEETADPLRARQANGEKLRVFSVGIGGLDLGMGQALARASAQRKEVTWGGAPGTLGGTGPTAAAPGPPPPGIAAPRPVPPPRIRRPRVAPQPGGATAHEAATSAVPPSREAWREDPSLLPPTVLPDHGPSVCAVGAASCEADAYRLVRGQTKTDGKPEAWILWVMGADGPDPVARKLVLGSKGEATTFERLETGRWIRYRFAVDGRELSAIPAVALPSPPGPRPVPGPVAGLVALEVTDPAAGSARAGSSPRLTVSLRTGGAPPLVAEIPRITMQRLVLGRQVDLTPQRPLPGLSPLPAPLSQVGSVLVMQRPERTLPPWVHRRVPIPGEEDAARLAAALRRWWVADEAMEALAVAVGTDAGRSPARMSGAPLPGKKTVLILPDDGFPPPRSGLREELAAAWTAGEVSATLPEKIPSLVVVVSAESPTLLGTRLRELSREPGMKGKLLAVYSLGGPIRVDLPASLLAEGNLAGIGVAVASPVGITGTVGEIAGLAAALVETAGQARSELLPGPFTWYY
jgi:hypothetical protein